MHETRGTKAKRKLRIVGGSWEKLCTVDEAKTIERKMKQKIRTTNKKRKNERTDEAWKIKADRIGDGVIYKGCVLDPAQRCFTHYCTTFP